MEKLAGLVIRFRWFLISMVVLLTAFFGFHLVQITINSDIISTLPEDDPIAGLYLSVGDEFGGNDMGMIVLETDVVLTNEVLLDVHRITDSIMFMDGIATVTSLTNVMDIRSSEWGIEIGKLIDPYDLPVEQQVLDHLGAYIDSVDMYRGSLISEDGTSTVIMFTLTGDADHQVVARGIRDMTEGMDIHGTLFFGGVPMMMYDVNSLILSDITLLVPLVFVLIAVLLFISFRNWRGIVLPLLTAGIAVIWTMGLMSWTGYELTVITNIIPVVLLAIGSAYSIHVINSVQLHLSGDPSGGLARGIAAISVPVVLASVTTAIGFVSFVFGAYLTMIREFGVFTAAGTLFSLLLSLTFVPAMLAITHRSQGIPESRAYSKQTGVYLPQRVLLPLVNMVLRYPGRLMVVWGASIVLFVSGIFLIQTSINMIYYFKPHFPTRIAEDLLQEKFGGSTPLFVVFEGDLQDPELLQKMDRTASYMKGDPNVGVTQSVADLIAQMNDAMDAGHKVPDDRSKIEQLWFLLEGQDIMPQLVNSTLDRGVISGRFASVDTRDMERITAKMKSYVAEHSTDQIQISFTGMPSVYVQLNNSLIRSQFSSLILAILLVLTLVSIMLRSLKRGVIATSTVVATILILLGFMGLAGIALDIATVLVASVALGLGIDYAIHTITGYKRETEAGEEPHQAIRNTILTRGSAILINVASVSAGFLMLLFSNIIPLQHFGLLVAVSMIGSGTGALTLLPVLLILAQRDKKRSTGLQGGRDSSAE